MRPVPSSNCFSPDRTIPKAAPEKTANPLPDAITVQHSPPRPVMLQSHSADNVSVYSIFHSDPCKPASQTEQSGRAQAAVVAPISLHSTAMTGELGLMRHLIKSGASVNRLDTYGYTPLMDAAETGQLDAVKLLLKKGANPDVANSYGIQALHIAAYKGHSEIVDTLIQGGQSVNQPDGFGNPPLVDAINSRNAATVKTLIRAGANPNVAAPKCLTALMLSVDLADISLLELLLQNPQLNNIDAVDTDGKTALNLAIRKHNPVAVEHLLKAGATIDYTGWPLISDKVISDLLVHRHSLFRPGSGAGLCTDNALTTKPVDCIKQIATLLSGAIPLQQAGLNKALHGLDLSSFIVEAVLRTATHACAIAPILAGEGHKPTASHWVKTCIGILHVALADPSLHSVFNAQGLGPDTVNNLNAIVRGQIKAVQAAAHLTERETADSFRLSFITECLHLSLKDGSLSGPEVYTFLVNQGLHHELASLLVQVAVAAWDRVKKMDKPIHVGYVLPGNFLGRAMEAMGKLLENEIQVLLQVEFSLLDNTYKPSRHASTTLAPAARAALTHRHQTDLGIVMQAFGLH